jgi:hypothetical protein
MKRAIEKAIYYSNVHPTFSIDFEYSDKESFQNIINTLTNNIDVITFFAPKDDPIYPILKEMNYIYEKLLFDKTSCVYLINRKDVGIKFSCIKSEDEVGEDISKERIAILKIDSILSEYYLQKKGGTYTGYSLSFLFGMLGAFSFFSLFSKN